MAVCEAKKKALQFPEDIKKTKQREEIAGILWEASKPLSAVDIYHSMMKKKENGNFAISTVYRALTVFEEKGYVEKSTLPGGDMAYYEWSKGKHKHYAVCLGCHKLIPLKSCPFEHAQINTEEDNFTVTGHKLELYGYCRKCKCREENKS